MFKRHSVSQVVGAGFFQLRARRDVGITIVEVLVSLTVLLIVGGSTLSALVQMNNQAVVSRLMTSAHNVAQNQIELVLTDTPFVPQQSLIPDELTVGTKTDSNVLIYMDPETDTYSVVGTMTTTVADTNTSVNGFSLHVYKVTVTVTYKFRSKTYNVSLNALRASDV